MVLFNIVFYKININKESNINNHLRNSIEKKSENIKKRMILKVVQEQILIFRIKFLKKILNGKKKK